MPNKKYNRGRAKEYKIMAKYRAKGFYCIRSAGSLGAVDVIALKDGEVVPIQVKQDPTRPISRKERIKMSRFENMSGFKVRIE